MNKSDANLIKTSPRQNVYNLIKSKEITQRFYDDNKNETQDNKKELENSLGNFKDGINMGLKSIRDLEDKVSMSMQTVQLELQKYK